MLAPRLPADVRGDAEPYDRHAVAHDTRVDEHLAALRPEQRALIAQLARRRSRDAEAGGR